MEQFFQMLQIQAVLLLYLLIGVLCRKRGILDAASRDGLTAFLLRAALPCVVFKSFDQEITPERLLELSQVLATAFAVGFFAIFLGKLLYRKEPAQRRSVLQYGTLISNCGFIGPPVISSAYGPSGLLYASVFILPTYIFMWSAGVAMFDKADWKTTVKKVLLNPSIIAVELGLLYVFFPFPIPSPINTVLTSVGGTSTPVSMIVIGAILADIDPRSVVERSLLKLAAVRLLLIPLALLAAMRLLGMGDLATQVSVVMAGIPTGASSALMAQQYGADPVFASKGVFVTTLLSLLTIPLLSLLL